MNTIALLKKVMILKAFTLKKKPETIAVASLLLQAAAAFAGILAASDALPTAAALTIHPRLAVRFRSAVSAQNTSNSPMDNPCLCATDASKKLNQNYSGMVPRLWPHQLLNSKTSQMTENNEIVSELDRLVIEGDRLNVWKTKMAKRVRRWYGRGLRDEYIVQFIEKRVKKELRKQAFTGTPFLPPKLDRGNHQFGRTLDHRIIWTMKQWFNAHILTVANTGSGKTNASKVRVVGIAPTVPGCWLFDLRKTEYRQLRPVFKMMGMDLKIIRGRMLKINPLFVPLHVEPIDYASTIADVMVRVLNLPPRASNLLRTTIIQLYAQYGVLEGHTEATPTLFHLYEAVRNNRNANAQSRQAVLDSLETLLVSMGRDILGYHQGWDIQELAKQHLAVELSGLPEIGKDLILSTFLTSEFTSRIAAGLSNVPMSLWATFDESQRLFSRKKETDSYGGNPLVDMVGLIRGVGIGMEISVLTTTDLSPIIPSLTSLKIMGRCGSINEYTAAGRFMGLSQEQISWSAHNLVPGTFIGQVGEGKWRYPFVFRVPLLKNILRELITDTEADRSTRKVVTSRVIKAELE